MSASGTRLRGDPADGRGRGGDAQSPERAFLCAAVRSFVLRTAPPDLPAAADWDRLDRLTALHCLSPLLGRLYGRDAGVPENRVAVWRDATAAFLLRYEKAVRATVHLAGRLEQERIPAVVMRGMAVAHTLYPDPCLRPMYDVDVLVPAAARRVLPAALARHGLTPDRVFRRQYVYRVGETVFEIHWSLLTPERYRHVAPLADWIGKRRPLDTPAGRFHVLPPEEEMLAQVCHAYVHHGLDAFHPLVDIALAASRADLDWGAATGWCRRASVARMAHFTLSYADHLFDLGLGDRLARFGVPAPPGRAAVFAAHDARLFGEDRPRHYILRRANMVRLAERPWTRAMEVLRILRPQEVAATIRRFPPGRWRRGSQSA